MIKKRELSADLIYSKSNENISTDSIKQKDNGLRDTIIEKASLMYTENSLSEVERLKDLLESQKIEFQNKFDKKLLIEIFENKLKQMSEKNQSNEPLIAKDSSQTKGKERV